MTDEANSSLRRRMIEDMTIRKLAPKTQHDYVQRVKNFAAFIGRSPDTASFEDVRRYQLHLAASDVGVPEVAFDEQAVTFKWKDYRIEGRDRYKSMTLATDEFIRRFLIHVLPKGLHRIRHYGLFAKGSCADNVARARELLAASEPRGEPTAAAVDPSKPACPCCGGRLIVIEVFARGAAPRHRPTAPTIVIRIDTS